MQWQGGGCSRDGGNNGGGDVIAMAATAGVGPHNESGHREEEDTVRTAMGMLSREGQAVDNVPRGGGQMMQHVVIANKEEDNDSEISPSPPLPATGTATDMAMPLSNNRYT
jgi:hypothetical protein